MLGIDHQHGRFRSGEPAADPGVFGGERGRFASRGVRRAEVYAWVERTLVRHAYAGLGRADKEWCGSTARMTGRSRAQVTRLIAAHRKTGWVKAAEYRRTSSPRATRRAM